MKNSTPTCSNSHHFSCRHMQRTIKKSTKPNNRKERRREKVSKVCKSSRWYCMALLLPPAQVFFFFLFFQRELSLQIREIYGYVDTWNRKSSFVKAFVLKRRALHEIIDWKIQKYIYTYMFILMKGETANTCRFFLGEIGVQGKILMCLYDVRKFLFSLISFQQFTVLQSGLVSLRPNCLC